MNWGSEAGNGWCFLFAAIVLFISVFVLTLNGGLAIFSAMRFVTTANPKSGQWPRMPMKDHPKERKPESEWVNGAESCARRASLKVRVRVYEIGETCGLPSSASFIPFCFILRIMPPGQGFMDSRAVGCRKLRNEANSKPETKNRNYRLKAGDHG